MNFYEHQDRAQRRTKIIVFLFIAAVFCIIAIVGVPIGIATDWSPEAVGGTTLACLLIVGIATLVKLNQLRSGGHVVAEMLGGTQLDRSESDRAERRVQNIVEEMAIASGMPVPPVYIIEDNSINAFAAGWSTSDAVIGVTRGCIETLNRDELQGVIAHEFSHISHGDMRINIRLIGVIFGIMVLGITGWILVRYVGPALLRSTSRSTSKDGAGAAGIGLGIILFGLFLAMCGAIGSFFGRLIQAAVSRQREFLADASAVQFTRNPDGIGGALRKIGGLTPATGFAKDADQCNHMFFSQAVTAMFASHPPITERIARVEGLDVSTIPEVPHAASSGGVVSHFSAQEVISSVQDAGVVQTQYIERARSAIGTIEQPIVDALHSSWSARLVMFALIRDPKQKEQEDILAKSLTIQELKEFNSLLPFVEKSDKLTRLPMVDIAAPSLQRLSPNQRKDFQTILLSLIQSDGQVDRFEWVFLSVIRKHLAPPRRTMSKAKLSSLASPAALVLGMLSYCGQADEERAKEAFQHGAGTSGLQGLTFPNVRQCTMKNIDGALAKLDSLRFVEKERLLQACVACVTHDDKITVSEAETLRAIGHVLECPIPLFGL